MYYHLTMKHSSSISLCTPGRFSTSERHREFVLLRGPRFLELWTYWPGRGPVLISQQELFGEIVSLKPLSYPREGRDLLVGGSNEGKTFILLFDIRKKAFIEVFSEYCEEQYPSKLTGHFVATDPRGRIFITGAKENIKKVRSVRHLNDGRIEISAMTFEKNKELDRGVTYDILVLYDEPGKDIVSFASTEVYFKECLKGYTYEPSIFVNTRKQSINFFDVNLRTKTVTLKRKEFLDQRSNFLMEVPGGSSGPGGVLIFCQNQVVYKSDKRNLTCPIPCRISELKSLRKPVLFINCTMYLNRTSFYYLAQNEFGDIFKITLALEDTIELQMQYFDSLPLATALCILEPYHLFVAYESGDHAIYKVLSSSLCNEPVFSSCLDPAHETSFYQPVPGRRLKLWHEFSSLNPIMTMEMYGNHANHTFERKRLYAACGAGKKSSLLTIDQGLDIRCGEGIRVDDLYFKRPVVFPPSLNKLWSCVYAVQIEEKDFIILSYAEKTVVFNLIGKSLQPVYDVLDISLTSSTLACRILPSGVIVQITSQGIYTRYQAWRDPLNQRVVACALNDFQALVMLENTHLYYLEIDMVGMLIPSSKIMRTEVKVQCAVLSSDKEPAHFAVLGLVNNYIYVISLHYNTLCEVVYRINSFGPVTSLLFCHIGPQDPDYLKLFIGLYDGVLLITHMVKNTGRLSDIHQYTMGSEPIKLFHCGEMIMISTNYPWLYLEDAGKTILRRLVIGKVETACNFRDPQQFFVFSPPVLRLAEVGDLSKEVVLDLLSEMDHTPRSMVTNSKIGVLVMAEADHNVFTPEAKMEKHEEYKKILNKFVGHFLDKNVSDESSLPEISAGFGMWSSGIRIIHPIQGIADFFYMDNSIVSSVALSTHQNPYVFIAYKKIKSSTSCSGLLNVYEFSNSDANEKDLGPLCHLDGVELNEEPSVMVGFSVGVLVGVSKDLMMFSINHKKELYLESECQCASSRIECISTNSENIVVGDSTKGLVFLKYHVASSTLVVLGQDKSPFVTTCCFLDPITIARADKFGNIAIVRVNAFKMMDSKMKELWRNHNSQIDLLAHFHVGEVVLSLQMTPVFHEGQRVLLYATLSGTMGIIAHLGNPEEKAILSCLEHFMLLNDPVLSQDHMTFRAPHTSEKKIIDGDLCEQFQNLNPGIQTEFFQFYFTSPEKVFFKLAEIRSKFLY